MMSDEILNTRAAPVTGPQTLDIVSIGKLSHIPSRGEDQYCRNEYCWHCIGTEIRRSSTKQDQDEQLRVRKNTA